MEKTELRAKMKQKLSALEKPVYEQKSFEMAARLYALPEWKQADKIAVTLSSAIEVDTWQLIRAGWQSGKSMCVPKCHPDTKSMTFHQLTRFTELEKVYAGLYEPDPDCTPSVASNAIDLVLVPGLLFNRQGYRIGFGGGYYDRFLAGYTGPSVSLAFSFQVQLSLPIDSYDLPVQKIVTEEEVIEC